MKIGHSLACAVLLLCGTGLTNAALADDNCKQVIESLNAQFPSPPFVLAIGACPNFNTTVELGKIDASLECFKVGEQGVWGFPDVRVVSNWILFNQWNTWLGFCVGYKGTPPPLDPAKAEAARKQLEDLRSKLKQ